MEILENFTIQADTVLEFNQFLHGKVYCKEDRESLGICVHELLYDLLEKWSTSNLTKQSWKNVLPKDLGHIIFIHGYNDINNVSIQILINKDGIHLEMSIASPENLPGMPDDFWMQWLELQSFGDFELIEHEPFSEMDKNYYPQLFPNKNGNLFSLMRSIIAFPLIYEREIEWESLSINWSFEKYSIKEVFEKGCLAFERLCHLNNRLIDGK